jgi:RimJ/RimL family protein N-acetyltransferase
MNISPVSQIANSKEITLRAASSDDCNLLFKWVNDAQTRHMSLNSTPIDFSSHQKWFSEILLNPNQHLYIALEGQNAFGTCRANFVDGYYHLSWQIFPPHRGKGLGLAMVKLLVALHLPCRAVIKKDNFSSVKIAQNCGLQLQSDYNGLLTYTG